MWDNNAEATQKKLVSEVATNAIPGIEDGQSEAMITVWQAVMKTYNKKKPISDKEKNLAEFVCKIFLEKQDKLDSHRKKPDPVLLKFQKLLHKIHWTTGRTLFF